MKVKIPIAIGKYLWTRYLPDTSYKTYAYIIHLNQSESDARDLKKELLEANLGEDESLPQVIEEKKRVLENIGLKFPETRKEDLALLEKFRLIEIDEDSKSGYKIIEDIKRPEDVLDLDEEEKRALEDIRFEIDYANEINCILSLILANGGRLDCPASHITNMTKVGIADIRTVLNFLVNEEESLKYFVSKDIMKLKKQDRVIIAINEPIFKEKRFILDQE